jgi:mannonate dehydratase
MIETLRWFGPKDGVTLKEIRQAGADGVITSLHEIPYGNVWPAEKISDRKAYIESHDLQWRAVESLPVHEDIKLCGGSWEKYIENYKRSLANLGAAGIKTVIYNFMVVLDWVRTDLAYKLPDESTALRFSPVEFAAFEIYLLRRKGAESCYTKEQVEAARTFFQSMNNTEKKVFEQSIIDVFPGMKLGLTIDDVRNILARYDGIGLDDLRDNYRRFLEAVIPAASDAGVRMAVHPDDPPFSLMGLPRIVSNGSDIAVNLSLQKEQANGLCFCTGSLSPLAQNDLPAMVEQFGPAIHVAHLRNTAFNADGSFYEADHLDGSVDMYTVVKKLLIEEKRRRESGNKEWKIPYRPDHGHRMLDDLQKPPPGNPGYSLLGRMRGLAELRGLAWAIKRETGLE